VVSFRYVLTAHKGFDQAAAQHFGIEQSQPMIAVPVAANSNDYKLPLTISNDAVLVTACHPSADGKGWLVRLFNGSNKPQALKVGWTGASRLTIYRTDLWGNQKTKTQSTLILSPMEIESLCLTP
jgi:alpha-mannosidase